MTLSIHRRADHYGSRTAVIDHDSDSEETYDDLAKRARESAARLQERGVGEGDSICVLSRNRPELLGLFYAAVDLGAILAPISYRLPADVVATLRERIDPSLTLYEPRFAELLDDGDRVGDETTVTFESFREFEVDPADEVDSNPDPGATATVGPDSGATATVDPDPDRPLLYLHTGGTTGVPKVVVIPYRQVEWNCITEVAAWGLGKRDVSPVLLPMFHTGGWNLLTLPTLYVGGQVVLHREFDPDAALESIETHGATHVFAVAAIFQAMAASDRFEETDLSSVEWFMSGGGPTPADVMDAYRERGGRFTQGYGLTEGGPNNLYVDPYRSDAEKSNDSVGRPFPDCRVRVVDDGVPVETGAVGELEIAGPMTADGYLETEDGTFHGEWVSTGDLARIDEDGDVTITGRTDNMFVSGGENVYPEEIEDVLEEHPAVAEAGVVAVPHEKWGTVGKAVIALAEAAVREAETRQAIESYCRDHLAGFQVPRAWAFVDELPRSGPGKLDRGALEAEFGDGASDVGSDTDTDDGGGLG